MDQSRESGDYYRVLGVSPDADQETIGRAYRRLMKAVHPDARRGRSDPSTGRRVAELVEAWRVLGDPSKRLAYDAVRRGAAEAGALRQDKPRPPGQGLTLEIQPAVLNLGVVQCGEFATGVARLIGSGGPATVVEILDTAPTWLTVSRSEPGKSPSAFPVEMSVRVDTGKLAPRRRYQGELVFRLSTALRDLHSPEQRLTVIVRVAPKQPPRLKAEPAGWVVRPRQCLGAPHSLLLRLSLSNVGGGSITGTVRGERWMRVTPGRFGPLKRGENRAHIAVELNCEEWAASGWRDGRLVAATGDGDLLELALIADRGSGERRPLGASKVPLALLAAAPSAIPALLLLVGAWRLAVPVSVALGLVQSALFRRLSREESLSTGPPPEATTSLLGPRVGGGRFWLLLVAWATMGAMLAVAAGDGAIWGLSTPPALWWGTAAGAVVSLGISSVGIRMPGVADGVGRKGWGVWLLGVAIGWAWASFGALLAQAATGGGGSAEGAAVGWLTGSATALARDPCTPSHIREKIGRALWGFIPMVSSGAGAAVGLAAAVDWGLVHRGGQGAPWGESAGFQASSLLALPAESFTSFVMALAALAGLALGLSLGLATVLPVIDVVAPDTPKGQWSKGSAWVRALGEEMVLRHAGIRDLEVVAGKGVLLTAARCALEAHWSSLVVGASAILLLLYAAGQLLLAITAMVGAMVG